MWQRVVVSTNRNILTAQSMFNNISANIAPRPVIKGEVLTCVFVLLLYSVFLTISWDIVSVRLMGNTFRLTQLFLIFCLAMWIIIKTSNQSFALRDSGLVEKWLILFVLWCICTDITSYNLKRSIFYSLWLVFNFMMIAMVVDYIGISRARMRQLLRIYFLSFTLICIIAVATSILEYCGIITLYTNPETGEVLAREQIRMFGLCYEPSYFATYLMTYLTTISYLKLRGSNILRELNIKRWHYLVVLVAFVGSFSRAGFVVFLPIAGIFMLSEIIRAGKYRNWLLQAWCLKAGIAVIIFISVAGFTLVSKTELAENLDQYFFTGMGVGAHADSAHSSGTRLVESVMTLQTGLMQPWMGVGMGGYGAFLLENIKKFPSREFWFVTAVNDTLKRANKWTFIEVRAPEAMCVTLEVFATTGVPGLILWLIINFIIPFRLIKLSKKNVLDDGMREFLRAMAYGHIALFAILHFNQNIMRPYYWLHIAMCCATYLVAKAQLSNNLKPATINHQPPNP